MRIVSLLPSATEILFALSFDREVGASSLNVLGEALARFAERPELRCLNPKVLGEVGRDIWGFGEQTRRGRAAEALLEQIGERLALLEQSVAQASERPRVAFLEWLQPFYVGGHWVPEMIELAGGHDVLGRPHTPSFRVTLEEIVDATPDIILVSPCGYGAQHPRNEYLSISHSDEWNAIPAVRSGGV